MGNFFKPWRRKFGVVTLLFALLLMGMWVRSLSVVDEISVTTGTHTQLSWQSVNGNILGYTWQASIAVYEPIFPFVTCGTLPFTPHTFFDPDEAVNVEWRVRWPGIGVVKFPSGIVKPVNSATGSISIKLWYVSYWFLVIPLTLLAAWLLFSKRRPAEFRESPMTIAN